MSPRFQRASGGHIAADVTTHDADEVARHRRLVEDGTDGWREVEEPKPLTPKQRLQQDAAALGLSADGTADEITARVDAKVAELRKQAGELKIDAGDLSPVELAAAIDAK